MWKRIKETHYFLFFSTEHGYEICITDNINVWTILYSQTEFLDEIKTSNDGLELADDNEYLRRGMHLVSNIDYLTKFEILKLDNGLTLFISLTMSFRFPFYLKCKLSKGSQELFYQKVTRPLLKSISDLRESQSELRRLLIKKDMEIEEYKASSGVVDRYLQTVPFNDAEHMFKHKVYDENFSLSPKTITENVKHLDNTVGRQMQNRNENQAVIQEPVPNVRPQVNVRPEGNVRPERNVRPEGNVRPERNVRPEGNVRPERNVRPEVNVRPERNVRPEGNVRPERNARPEGNVRPERNVRPEVNVRPERNVRPEENVEREANVRPEVNVRPEPQAPVKQEPDIIEPDTTVPIDPVPYRKNGIKSEDDETSVSITASVSYQPELRRESLRPHVPRKRTKFNL
ncbi:translation initiation factor IF-2 isoform X3 [Spodoptera frugiperda]|uniref:Non-homologous end-joining factor 1 n=1 Tax=Spodoptera frugiperda TaxID=7108 RepID=A0A9R0EBK4_SPOFR|nr:translation initiation factor IF-2 isoform X3 [Spodoptera frugiperda]